MKLNTVLIVINLVLAVLLLRILGFNISAESVYPLSYSAASSSEGQGKTLPSQEVDNKICSLDSVKCPNELTNQIVYAYNSEVSQCDDTPFITASGYDLRNGGNIVANNCYPFGTIIRIGERTYRVEDRLNSRYDCSTWDIWMPTYEEAISWGKKIKEIIIL